MMIEILKQALAEQEKSLKELKILLRESKEEAKPKDIIIQNLKETLGFVYLNIYFLNLFNYSNFNSSANSEKKSWLI
jgi:hypothetical protein